MRHDSTRSTEAVWDRAAQKYAGDVERDVTFLRAGGVSLLDVERRTLGNLSGCARAVHLQCSHGLDALSLLNLGVAEVVGVDISQAMLAQARDKSERLGARATWVLGDVLELPPAFDGAADLVYTGKGALPWIRDLARWAAVVRRLLRPGGRFYMLEGHPLNWIWEPMAPSHRLRVDGRGYFDDEPRANDDFPAQAVARFTPAGHEIPVAWEHQWTLGVVISALADAELTIGRLEEYPEHFWPQFREIAEAESNRLPHSYAVLARRAG